MANWAFLVLYPDPLVLVQSIHTLQHPAIDAAAVRTVAATLPISTIPQNFNMKLV